MSPSQRSERVRAYVVSAALCGAMLWPLAQPTSWDSFPLSSYPMFARERPRELELDHVVAVDAAGRRTPLAPAHVGSSEVLQAKILIARAVARGRSGADELCVLAAERIADDTTHRDAVAIEVRRDRWAVLPYFAGEREPLHSRVFARCEPRRSP